MSEIWDLYDINYIKTGQTIVRGDAFKEGDYHLVVHICIFNKQGLMLIQQRHPHKDGWPNLWDVSVGGSAIAGEDSCTAAEREVLEELGCEISLKGERPYLTIHCSHGFDDFYLVEKEIDHSTLSLQFIEVQAVRWASYSEIIEMIEFGLFIPYHKSLIELLFNMRKQRGCY